jgi:hypothetical protein
MDGDGDGELHVKPWVENEGRTRVYAVPYSEHSSYTELREFIKVLKPKKITPTVNAATKEERVKLVNKHFLDLIDLKEDANKLDFYFKRGSGVTTSSSTAVAVKTTKANSATVVVINSESDEDGDFDVKVQAEVSVLNEHKLWNNVATAPPKLLSPATAPLEPFPLECVAVVRAGEYTQFRSRAHVEQRLKELGATILRRITPNVTHIIVPSKGEHANEAARLNALRQTDEYKDHSSALRCTESWLMRHIQAHRHNVAPKPSAQQLADFAQKKVKDKESKSLAAKRKREQKKNEASAASEENVYPSESRYANSAVF